jgi:Holliday junction resolvase RusA-like endonuclease
MSKFMVSDIEFNYIENKLEFTMNGPIMVQARPKITYRSRNKPVYYDPSHYDKKLWKTALINALQPPLFTSGLPIFHIENYCDNGIELNLLFIEKRPKIDFDSNGFLKIKNHKFPYQRDIDNMVKFIMDAMLGVTYKDDSAVVKVISEKMYLVDENVDSHVSAQEQVFVTVLKK